VRRTDKNRLINIASAKQGSKLGKPVTMYRMGQWQLDRQISWLANVGFPQNHVQ
jgi:hypothetical protein